MPSPTAAQHRALSKATRSTNACAPRSGISPRRRRRLRPTVSSRPAARSA
jgi:hypothetical protein